MPRCKVMVGRHFPEPCWSRAPFVLERWDEYEGRQRKHVCEEHAVEALNDGYEVFGPKGGALSVDEKGDLHEEDDT